MKPAESRVQEIDGLRGVAILSVVILHYVIFPMIPFLSKIGIRDTLTLLAFGVDLFFVISGYLIGTILLKVEDLAGIRAFYIRRILRIWPLYYLLLSLVYFALPSKDMFSNAPYWSFPLFIFNFWESSGVEIHPMLGTLWSLAIEEQFYLVGPLFFYIFNKKQIVPLLLTYVLVSPFLRLWLVYQTEINVWKFTPTRLDGICIGLLLSIFLSSGKNVEFVADQIKQFKFLAIFLLALLVPAINMLPYQIWSSFGYSLAGLAFGCVLLVVQVNRFTGRRTPFLDWGTLRYLGLRCYSIYLFHLFFALVLTKMSSIFFIGIAIATILLLLFSHFSWLYIELPLIRLGQRFSYSRPPNSMTGRAVG